MIDDMGLFRTEIEIAPLAAPDRRQTIANVLVDAGSEYTSIPTDVLADLGIVPVRIDRFETADGRVLERPVGFAMIHAGGGTTPSVAVFAGENDMVLLGAIALEGLNLRVDLVRRALVDAGPCPPRE